MELKQLVEIAKKRIDVPNMIFDVVDQILEPALNKLVQDSATPFDDVAKAALYPPLRAALHKEVSELWEKL